MVSCFLAPLSLDASYGIVLILLKSNSKLRLPSPWAFYCQAIRIFYHLHYAHKARIISSAAAFRRPPLPRPPKLVAWST